MIVTPTEASIESLFTLERIDKYLFRSKSLWKPAGSFGVFGGQVVSQALRACLATVGGDFSVHSLHSYFIKLGTPDIPIIYEVDPTRDGKSFSTRSVRAIQNNTPIFMAMLSFQKPEKCSIFHSFPPVQSVQQPEDLEPTDAMIERLSKEIANEPNLVNTIARLKEMARVLEIRWIEPLTRDSLVNPKVVVPARQYIWFRLRQPLGDDPSEHQAVAAYATDHIMPGTLLLPHGLNFFSDKVTFFASLDHSLWFHQDFRLNSWMLYEMESSRLSGGRGYVTGKVYTQALEHVLTVTQEALVRLKE